MRSALGLLLVLTLAGCKAPVEQPGPCTLSFSDQGSVRVFAVGHHFTLDDAQSYERYEQSFRRHLDTIGPCLSTKRPNLVVFPEDAGLIAWFIGRRAMLARGAPDTGLAFQAMYAGYYRQSDAYRLRYPGISAARGLTLALGDTAWRAMDRTFGGIARDYGVWVITSANVPDAEVSRDPADVAAFGDPEASGAPLAYVAKTGEVFNQAILYAPGGRRVDAVKKAFLTDPEGPALIDLTPGPMAELRPFETAFGKVGAAISRDAFYPPFLQRLDDLDAELIVQPEAWTGWTVAQEPGDWLPDVILASGWTHTQKQRAFRHSVAPMLTGNLFDQIFDGQPWITKKAEPTDALFHFVGSKPLPGWQAMGPWAVEEPPASSEAERRAALEQVGRDLLPGSGSPRENQYADSVIGADLKLYRPDERPAVHPVTPSGEGTSSAEVAPAAFGHQIEPDVAFDGRGRAFAVWADNRDGEWQIRFSGTPITADSWTAARVVAPSSARQRKPAITAAGDGRVAIAWQEGPPGSERIHIAVSTDAGASFTEQLVEDGGAPQWEPDLAFNPGGTMLVVVWTDFRDGLAPRIRSSTSLTLGQNWSVADPVTAPRLPTPPVRDSQYQPSVAFQSSGSWVVAWIDYLDGNWTVWALLPGLPATQVSPPSDREILDSDPQFVVGAGGELVIAWDDQRQRRGHHDVRAATLMGGGWTQLPLVSGGAEEGAFVSRFRPAVGIVGGNAAVVFQDLAPSKSALSVAWLSGTTAAAPSRFDDSGSASNQLTRPRVAAHPDGSRAFVVFEDDRDGWSRIRWSALAQPVP